MRIFENVNILENGDISIERETANFHHIYNVLRAKIGEILEVVDIESKTLYVTEIKDGNGNLKVKDIIRKEEDAIKITIYQGAIKGERFEYFLEKTTELGVDKICIIPLKRNVVKFKEMGSGIISYSVVDKQITTKGWYVGIIFVPKKELSENELNKTFSNLLDEARNFIK